MEEIPKRLTPKFQTYRELFLKSGNLCAFPDCKSLITDEEGNFIGQLCHIEAAEPGGERFNPAMTNEERRSSSNLMLMCYPHHRITNNVNRYGVADLKKMKTMHELRFAGAGRAARERLARLNWAPILGAGVVAGIAVDEFARRFNSVLSCLASFGDDSAPVSLRCEIDRRLRYVPTGAIHYYSRDPQHLIVGDKFLAIFESAGWQIQELQAPPSATDTRSSPDYEHSMLMLFVIAASEQIMNARMAIDDVFHLCGFSNKAAADLAVRQENDYQLKFYVPVVGRLR